MDRRQAGTLAENSACAFLEAQGFTIFTRNYLRRVGELDVVARSGDLLVFGGANRRIYHGVPKVLDGTGPQGLGLPPGRLSITVRETGL